MYVHFIAIEISIESWAIHFIEVKCLVVEDLDFESHYRYLMKTWLSIEKDVVSLLNKSMYDVSLLNKKIFNEVFSIDD